MTPLSLKSLVDGAAGAKPVPAGKGQRVIVIGAGAAGIAAARRLTDAGFPVMLLEARQRIGGRIQTSSDFAAPLDLGAAWIHGIHGNPLTKLAGDYNVKTLATPYDDIQAFSSKGGGYSMEALGNAFEAFEKAMSRAKEKAEGWDADPSLAKAMAADLNLMTGKDAGQAAISSFQGEMGADLEELSTWWTEEDDAFDGEDYLLAQGYGAILNQLVQGLNLHPGQAVKEVKQRATHVEVKTQDRTYDCDVVVVTLPLGVLKAGAVRFEPALPLEKREAIQRLGMGVLNKVVLQFPQEGPWPFKKPWITVVPGEQGRYSEFLNMAPVTGKRILVHLAGGSEARRLETMDEGQLVAALLKVLRSATGASLAAPVKHAVTRWHSDPFSLGAYSHCAPGSSFKDMERLAAPVDSKLFFAGEATAVIPSGNRNRYYPGTVHGAWLSGLREADRIIAGFMGGKGGKKAYK